VSPLNLVTVIGEWRTYGCTRSGEREDGRTSEWVDELDEEAGDEPLAPGVADRVRRTPLRVVRPSSARSVLSVRRDEGPKRMILARLARA
jgi:hypothetical protein